MRIGMGLLAVGCTAAPPSGQALTDLLGQRGGCGDLYTYAADADGAVMLDVTASEGLVQLAQDAGETQRTTRTLPDLAVPVTLVQGTRVDDAACDDVIENGGPDIRRTWTATAGTIDITVVPGDDSIEGARATVELMDVELSEIGGSSVLELPGITWENVSVGWFAG